MTVFPHLADPYGVFSATSPLRAISWVPPSEPERILGVDAVGGPLGLGRCWGSSARRVRRNGAPTAGAHVSDA